MSSAHGTTSGRRGPGALEVSGVIMLLIGGIVLPVVGWIIGLALLWASSAWETRDKLLGTFVVPGGLAGPLLLGLLPMRLAGQPPRLLGLLVLITLVVAPIAVGIHLLRRAKRPI